MLAYAALQINCVIHLIR